MTVFSVLFFVVILWESVTSQHSVMFRYHNRVHLDWVYSRLPVRFHTHSESPKLFY